MEIIPHEGISITSIFRGVVGLTSIILIAYLLSNNKKKIDWKTILIGLSSQLIIAVAVLKVEFVRIIFEKIGQGFLLLLHLQIKGLEFFLVTLQIHQSMVKYLYFKYCQ
jgi:CNT family concentrative nucleoside transporter